MNSLLLIIDLQKNFITEYTEDIPSKVQSLINTNAYNEIIFTKFINNKDNNFYNTLKYEGCVKESDRDIVIDTKDYKVIEKNTYSAYNDELKKFIKEKNIDIVYLVGIDTDACVLSTAISLFDANIKVKVISSACKSHSGANLHNCAISILKKLIGSDNVL